MFEKNLNVSFLLDFYGDVLTERKRTVLDYYYNNDMSLSEIANEMQISRQGVRDIIKKAEDELFFYEEKLGLARKFHNAQCHASSALEICEKQNASEALKTEIKKIIESIE